MNWQHFRTLIWLRQRLFRNRMRRAGKFNAIITRTLQVVAIIASIAFFCGALGAGARFLPMIPPHRIADAMLYIWTGIVVFFLFIWMMGVMTELQRSEVLSIEKLFHFPISPGSAFVINYLSSLVCLSLILLFPAMLGFAIASVIAFGPRMLVSLPLLLAFVLMVTSVTYQFRGWLATLMVNKRRKRTIIATIGTLCILLGNSGNIINLAFQGRHGHDKDSAIEQLQQETKKLESELTSHKINDQQYADRLKAFTDEQRRRDDEETRQLLDQSKHWVSIADLAIPPGWMAFGVYEAVGYQFWPALAGTVLLCAIAGASLHRSYKTTLRFYLGDYRSDQSSLQATSVSGTIDAPVSAVTIGAPVAAASTTTPLARDKVPQPVLVGMVAKTLPGVTDEAAATGFATLRSLMRAPEVKMMLLTPIILGGVMLTTRLAGRGNTAIPAAMRSMIALGIVLTVVVSVSPLFQNQFGFDRNAFRTFVLCPAPRRAILLGKNLSLAPLVGVGGTLFLAIMQYMFPLRVTDFLATFVELLSAYLIVCLVGNQMSIVLPSAVRQGSMRSSETKVVRALARFVAMLAMLVAFLPLALPIGIDYLVRQFAWGEWIPTYLIFALLLALVMLFVYRSVLDYQGDLLQRREVQILEAVTTKDD